MRLLHALAVLLAGLSPLPAAEPAEPADIPKARIALAGSVDSISVDASVETVDAKIVTRQETVVGVLVKEGLVVTVRIRGLVKNLDALLKENGLVAEGTLDTSGKELILAGEVRARDQKGKDATFPKESVRAEGEATTVTADVGRGLQTFLALKNGAKPILLVGKVAAEKTKLSGRIRVSGKAQAWNKGWFRIEAETIEEVTK
jgi:hypothetical protein